MEEAAAAHEDALLDDEGLVGAGQGIAIISHVLVADAVATGLLVTPFPQTLRGATYHFVSAPEIATRGDVVALRTWFQRQLGER